VNQGLLFIHLDDEDLTLMKNRIKTYDVEKKASRNYYEHIDDFFQGEIFNSTFSRPRTPSSLKAKMLS
jgi:hypothetical protein